jgi:hypothetical protein
LKTRLPGPGVVPFRFFSPATIPLLTRGGRPAGAGMWEGMEPPPDRASELPRSPNQRAEPCGCAAPPLASSAASRRLYFLPLLGCSASACRRASSCAPLSASRTLGRCSTRKRGLSYQPLPQRPIGGGSPARGLGAQAPSRRPLLPRFPRGSRA